MSNLLESQSAVDENFGDEFKPVKNVKVIKRMAVLRLLMSRKS